MVTGEEGNVSLSVTGITLKAIGLTLRKWGGLHGYRMETWRREISVDSERYVMMREKSPVLIPLRVDDLNQIPVLELLTPYPVAHLGYLQFTFFILGDYPLNPCIYDDSLTEHAGFCPVR